MQKKLSIFGRIGGLFAKELDEGFFEMLEEALILADAGVETADELCSRLRNRLREKKIKEYKAAIQEMINITAEMLENSGIPDYNFPLVLLVVGVNGAGKTTTIGKLSELFRKDGKNVIIAAGDTFRAAAGEQLGIWAERTGAQLIRSGEGSDPASVVFDAISALKARKADVLLCDTAGRLHNKKNLMQELEKIRRVIDREFDGCVRTLLVLDATTGLNGLEQSRVFQEAAKVDGIAITKLDGTAKGGIVLAVSKELGIPVWYAGKGEGIKDLAPFDAYSFARELFEHE